MPWETLDWARKARAGSPGRKAVLMVLAEYADENDSCYPSQALIADATEQSERTVRTQLAELEQRGLIRREHRGGNGTGRTSDRYFLLRQPAKSAGGATGNATGKPTPRATGRLLPPNNHEQLDVELPKRHTRESQSVDQLLVHSFGVFWSLYPRKEAKGAARKVWPAAVKAAGGPTPIIEGCKRFALDPNRDPRYTPHPATWPWYCPLAVTADSQRRPNRSVPWQ